MDQVKADYCGRETHSPRNFIALINYLQNFDPNTMIKDEMDRHSIFEIMTLLENRFTALLTNNQAGFLEAVNTSKLEISLKYLQTQNLQVRIMGLNQIKERTEEVTEKVRTDGRQTAK